MTALASGARLGFGRLVRVSSLAAAVIALLAVATAALLERRASPLLAPDRALTDVALGIVLPLLAYGSVSRALEGQRLDRALDAFARYGASRRSVALGVLASLTLSLAVSGAVIAAVSVIVTRVPADPLLLRDTLTSSWIGALAGAAYAAWFLLGSTFGRHGGGRFWALAVDWVVGAGSTAAALPWPRGHIRNLLGAEPVMRMPEWSASLALVLLFVLYATLALVRSPK